MHLNQAAPSLWVAHEGLGAFFPESVSPTNNSGESSLLSTPRDCQSQFGTHYITLLPWFVHAFMRNGAPRARAIFMEVHLHTEELTLTEKWKEGIMISTSASLTLTGSHSVTQWLFTIYGLQFPIFYLILHIVLLVSISSLG